jgi:rSAM/selenodomain-associated transferase 2/rSAM/selenodomain-associated transferase 1
MSALRRLILFTRFPEAGRAKTRLIPALGPAGAAALHRRLVLRTLRTGLSACRASGAELEIRFDGANEEALHHWLGDGWLCRSQGAGDLGEKMSRAFEDGFRQGRTATIIIGSDCPELTPEMLVSAFQRLEQSPVVLGPATDGGYYLVGLARPFPELFCGITWGTERVLAESVEILQRIKIKPDLLARLDDIDRPEDLAVWRRLVEHEESTGPRISVIIPALNEAAEIVSTLDSVQRETPHEVMVVDGGSIDETRSLAAGSGATVISSRPGRAWQMNAGAAQASGNLLVFLHADTILPSNWARTVVESLGCPRVALGAFGFQIAGNLPGKQIVEWTANWRSRWCKLPYGDQALFLRRAAFEEEGGFADLPIMEDYEFVRRLRRRGRIITVAQKALTSARRWQRFGVLHTTLRNQLIIAGYHLGMNPRTLAEFYRRRQKGLVPKNNGKE